MRARPTLRHTAAVLGISGRNMPVEPGHSPLVGPAAAVVRAGTRRINLELDPAALGRLVREGRLRHGRAAGV